MYVYMYCAWPKPSPRERDSGDRLRADHARGGARSVLVISIRTISDLGVSNPRTIAYFHARFPRPVQSRRQTRPWHHERITPDSLLPSRVADRPTLVSKGVEFPGTTGSDRISRPGNSHYACAAGLRVDNLLI